MNLYLRYFNSETLVTNVEDACAFLDSIPEIGFNSRIAEDVRQYFESDNRFPKRYKVRPKIYFIMIKTDANNMKEFKDYRDRSITKANSASGNMQEGEYYAGGETNGSEDVHVMNVNRDTAYTDQNGMEMNIGRPRQQPRYIDAPLQQTNSYRDRYNGNMVMALYTRRMGWYEGSLDFKRVVTSPVTGKNEYRDTHFVARCKAISGIDCYNRIVEHLRGRVDERSQFPSAKGHNFSFTFLGECKPLSN